MSPLTRPVLTAALVLGLLAPAAPPAAAQGAAEGAAEGAAQGAAREGGQEGGRQPHHPVHRLAHQAAAAVRHGAHAIAHPAQTLAAHRAARHAAPARPAPPRPASPPVPAVPVPTPPAPVTPAPPKGTSTGLPLPRFASLRADEVNLRGGPGTRYPIQWVYRRRDLPVKIEREFDVWRLVEDSDGVKGWVHQATLIGIRTFVIPGGEQVAAADAAPAVPPGAPAAPGVGQAHSLSSGITVSGRVDAAAGVLPPGSEALRAAPQADAALVAVLMPGIVGRIRACPAGSGWCKVSVRDYVGWLPRDRIWGLMPEEAIAPP